MHHLAYNIQDACATARVGRTALYEAIRTGELRAVKRGRRTLILANDLLTWLEGLPPIEVKPRTPPPTDGTKAKHANAGHRDGNR